MLNKPLPDNGLAGYAMFASILMLLIGAGYLIASMLPKNSRTPMQQPDPPQADKSSSPQSNKLTPREARQRQMERMQRWAEEDKAAHAAGKLRPLSEIPHPISIPAEQMQRLVEQATRRQPPPQDEGDEDDDPRPSLPGSPSSGV